MKQVFLSYARADGKKVKRLYDDLSRMGSIRVWFDRVDLLPGVKWNPAIRKAIRESDFFLAVLSQQSVSNRGFRHSELREALDVSKEFPEDWIFLVPTRLDDCPMPFHELEELNYADLFPKWDDGVARLCSTLQTSASSGKPLVRDEIPHDDLSIMVDVDRVGKSERTSIDGGKVLRRRKEPRRAHTVRRTYHYKVGLADLDLKSGIRTMGRVAHGLDSVQSSFHFTLERLSAPRKALTTMDRCPQLYLPRLPKSFYKRVGPLDTDNVICLTRRFLAFDEGSYVRYNHLTGDSPAEPRVRFISYAGLQEHAEAAGVTLEVAIAYLITAELVDYFLDLGYHDQTRNCPMDRTEDHSELTGGLRAGHFCKSCARALDKGTPFASAFRAMIAWGR